MINFRKTFALTGNKEGVRGYYSGAKENDQVTARRECRTPLSDTMFKRTRQPARVDDWSAFEAEAMPYLPDIFRVAMWRVRDRDAAEDLAQETFTEALKSFPRYKRGTNCRAWLVTIMYHLLSKRLRADSRLRLVSDSEERIAETIAYEPPTPQGITEEEVLRALSSLPSQFQEVVMLSDVEDFSYKEIAGALGVPVGTVMSRLHRGRKILRAELAAYANARGIGLARHEEESAQRGDKERSKRAGDGTSV